MQSSKMLGSCVGGGTLSAALPRRALKLKRLISPTSPLLPSHQFHPISRRLSASASPGAQQEQQQQQHQQQQHQQQQQQHQQQSPNLVALEYADLNLNPTISEELGLGHGRIRQHVNPLKTSLSAPVEVPDWNQVFRDPTLPLMVDIGSGSGRFLLWLAKRNLVVRNYLGLEIRKKLVKRSQFWVQDLALSNIHFMFANATTSYQQLVSTYPGPLMLVSILCPDPYFKKRHHKRRVVQKPLVDSIVNSLMPSAQVFIQSDVLDVALDMRDQFDSHSNILTHIHEIDTSVLCDSEGWLLNNPMGIRTEREIHAEFEGAKIYRRVYQKQM